MNRRSALTLALTTPALPRVYPAGAEDYPSRPVRVIVPFPAGSTADVIIRTVASPLT